MSTQYGAEVAKQAWTSQRVLLSWFTMDATCLNNRTCCGTSSLLKVQTMTGNVPQRLHRTMHRLERALEQNKVVHWTGINWYITYFTSSPVLNILQAATQKQMVSMDENIDKPIFYRLFSITNHF